ncbi:hypothetical protein S7711_06068 [Stachybotrys chartarum IBT 7711]|uniref:GDS1 winged helix domain-containing protein n=1 Tax=Stachybotrys chartarum (strain CBS 109288 / IBT 7711) TaxID=1280523 RepID=A0A084B229_STACB|nr:hypothetical protein S7711_06068 [Stachybotrys chartarum IBT 7711]KFA54740.1 hypothetical protein S40293_00756 [Stachybotrys chartarum IBT 40293]KFA76388.1 hypothetical protein S40288_04812 [Stachybotrys chartarum IBT 40288]
MPYNTRRKSLSLPSLGIHIPAARPTTALKGAARPSTSGSPPSSAASATEGSESPESHPSKRLKRAHGPSVSSNDVKPVEQTPPPSPSPAVSIDMSDVPVVRQVDLEGINDDIVEASIVQLQSTGNRPHLAKEFATILGQSLTSVQQSANPCALISSRLASYLKRNCWSALAPCPIAKELETVHPRRTYFFLTTCPRQPLPTPGSAPPSVRASIITPSVSLTDDSGSDGIDDRRRELSPSPEVDLSPPEFDDVDDDASMPLTPIGSFGSLQSNYIKYSRDLRRDSPPLEKDEREFTQTADVLQKRKLSDHLTQSESTERSSHAEYGLRDELWFNDNRSISSTTYLTSPAMKPSIVYSSRKEDESETWTRLNKMFEWDKGAESIEIDELDCLLDTC